MRLACVAVGCHVKAWPDTSTCTCNCVLFPRRITSAETQEVSTDKQVTGDVKALLATRLKSKKKKNKKKKALKA